MIGETLGHYQITKKIGSGGMGVVYKARDLHLDRFVALKILPAGKVVNPDRKRRFVQEAKAASALNHPNIIHIYDIASDAGVDFIAMEYVGGETLHERIGRRGLPLNDTLKYAVRIADALAKAHAAGIIHRDLKPSNIMVNEDDTVKILDFGLAKLTEKVSTDELALAVTREAGGKPLTGEGVIVGTVAYLSPEQAEGREIDPRSDVFSFGSVLYEMATGRRVFQGGSKISTMSAVLSGEPAPLGPDFPHDFEKVILRCLRKDPARRWQTMSDLKVALQELKEEFDSGKLSAVTQKPLPGKRRGWLFIPAALLIIATMAFAIWRFAQKPAMPTFETKRLTYESGLVTLPAISPDGDFFVYSSDRGGSLNLYLRQLKGKQSIRLTNHDAIDWLAHFSPDGSKIVFSSSRDGGGIYTIDTLGGQERRIADYGYFPRFSPDGSTIAYVVPSALVRQGKMFLIDANGGVPRPFQPAFSMASFGPVHTPPVWSPDGRNILFEGSPDDDPTNRDWWISPVAGGDPIRIISPVFAERSFVRMIFTWHGEYVYWSEGTTVGGMSIYRITISGPPWEVSGVPERITSPLGMQLATSISDDGHMVFSSSTTSINLWSWPLRDNETAVPGEGRQITFDSDVKFSIDAASNGSKLAYVASTGPDRGGDIRMRDIESGREEVIATTKILLSLPRLNTDGSRIAWRVFADGRNVSYLSDPGEISPRRLCEGCIVQDFFSHSKEVLVVYGGNQLVRQNLTTGEQTPLLNTTSYLMEAALSPDDRWVTFIIPQPDDTAALYIAQTGEEPVPRDAWIKIAEDRQYLGCPNWSPDGKLIYYASSRDDRYCLWAQRITTEGHPDGAPVTVLHLHQFKPEMYGGVTFDITSDTLYILLADVRGSAYMVNVGK